MKEWISGVQCETSCPKGKHGPDCQNDCECFQKGFCEQQTGLAEH